MIESISPLICIAMASIVMGRVVVLPAVAALLCGAGEDHQRGRTVADERNVTRASQAGPTTLSVAEVRRIDPALRDVPAAAAGPQLEAVLRLPAADAAQLTALEEGGIHFRSATDGTPRHLGSLYPVSASQAALARWAREGIAVRVSRPLHIAPTLHATGIETQATDLRGSAPTPTRGPVGERITVAAFETGINIFHPHFFRADAGAWPWIDVNDDGAFTLGVDGVDLDGDRVIADQERLQLLDYGFTVTTLDEGYGGTFSPAWDYLYVDTNSNGARDFGPAAGFWEATPGYGEAMFLPDDANGDGQLGPDERVIMLGTSQVAALRIADEVWTRGHDLMYAPPLNTSGSESTHGSAVLGIITGGQTRPFRGNRGHIPDADIVVLSHPEAPFDETTEAELVETLAWVTQDMHADVVNHSWGVRGDRLHLDGSNTLDTALSEASAEGAIQVCSAGNRGDKNKHRAARTSAGRVSFDAAVPADLYGVTVSSVTLDLHFPADEGSLACEIERPDGATHRVRELPNDSFAGLSVDAFRLDSPRGMALLSIEVSRPSDGAVGPGVWHFDCVSDSENDFVVHGLISDGVTWSWPGAEFIDATPTSTIVSPATSDGCISVGGYTLQYPRAGAALGDLEPYSSLGPRYDGAIGVDITAPVDAVAPTADPVHRNAYAAFSGTSGSAPQVAGIVGLMKSLDPELGLEEIRNRIHDGAAVDAQVGTGELPDPGWGYGRLRGYAAFTGDEPPPRPDVRRLELAVDYHHDDGRCAATVSVDDADWDNASFRWDDEYDGTWDTEFEVDHARTLYFDDEGEAFQIRADGAEGGFIVAGAVLRGEVPGDCFVPPAGGTDSDGGTSGSDEGTQTDGGLEDDGSTDTGDASLGGTADGCGCRSTRPPPAALALALLGLLHLRRRR